jgi:2-amino-4-hydroxy-6-hydroxymethyldihydropteridine diphosphokinase
MHEVYLGLGSNLGDRAANLAAAREALARNVLIGIRASSIYETEPWGPVPQGRYLNQAVGGSTDLTPRALLAKLFEIERVLGRNRARERRFGPRTIDLDILLYNDCAVSEPDLKVPHPRLLERAFVLVPLAEIAPDVRVKGIAIGDALARLDRSGVTHYTVV